MEHDFFKFNERGIIFEMIFLLKYCFAVIYIEWHYLLGVCLHFQKMLRIDLKLKWEILHTKLALLAKFQDRRIVVSGVIVGPNLCISS